MPIQQVLYRKKNGLARYDPKKQMYVGYRIDVVVNGVRHRDGGFASRRDALIFIDRLKSDARDRRNGLSPTVKAPFVSELFKKRLETMKHDPVIAIRVFAKFESLLESDLRVTDIRSSHFQLYVNARDVAPGTIRRELNELSAAFRAGPVLFPDELDSYTPPRIARPRNPKAPARHIITRDEHDAIVAHLQGNGYQKQIARMFSIAWFLGLRYGEIIKLKRSDLKGRTLKVIRWKTNDVTLFEDLPDEVLNVLKSSTNETEYFFSTKQTYPNSFYTEFGKAVKAAGLVYGKGKLDSVVFHSARHSYITRLVQVTDLATAKAFSGHSTDVMLAHYSHATPASKKAAMQKMYGQGVDLRKIYDKIRAGELSFEEFKKAIK